MADREGAPPPRRRLIAGLAGAAVLIAAAGAAIAALRPPAAAAPAEGAAGLPTVAIERTDLVEYESVDAELRYDGAVTVVAGRAGVVTWLPETGAELSCGSTVLRIDDAPTVLLCGDVPAWRDLRRGVEGRDVAQLEAFLRDAGYASAELTVDGEWTALTTSAVRAWQEAVGAPVDGVVALGEVVVLDGPRRVGELLAAPGAIVTPASPVLSATTTAVVAEARVPAHSRALFAAGGTVTVELPDGTTTEGVVRSVAIVAADEEQPDPVAVTIAIESTEAAAWAGARVAVGAEAARAAGVLVVPVGALTATPGGGYAVERVDEDGAVDLIPVRLGAFADGRVEITGAGLAAGNRVVVAG